ncbi:MAG: hypothetical protein KKF62_01445 [Bacteroidetes bacterium]|nr:hypothetical protein [Bacteroidota bacterium]MBU1115119.1 hypothetical protein [Bacteroidota bacterium]MBU1799258.1 hypothetical protein [Bacteroidota bacterium]
MTKNLLKILFLLIALLSVNVIAQNSDNVDLRAKVKQQMLKAQGNLPMVEKNSTSANSNYLSFPNISTTVFRILILLLSSIIALSLVFLRRVKIQHKQISKQFKENIRLIREESYKQPIDYSLTPVRKSLLDKIENCLEENTISYLAKKLKIAKGEIHLVNSIKSYASGTNIARG